MYSKMQFSALELMCRERAVLAKREMEYALFEYWLAEAEEWKVVCSWSLLFAAIIAVVRQKLHSSSCSDFRDRLLRRPQDRV
jgi:hypothetical protein